MKERINWDDYFLNITKIVSERSTCDRGKPGCVIVKDNRILCTGYAGSPPGFPHCDEVGHDMEERIRFYSLYDPYITNKEKHYNYNEEKIRYESFPTEHCIRTIHAEQNAIIQAVKNGISIDEATCYVTMTPCRICAMMLISCGIKRIVANKLYQKAQESIDMFNFAGIEIIHKDNIIEKY